MKNRCIRRPAICQIEVQKKRRESRKPICEENFLGWKVRTLKLKALSNIYQNKGNRSTFRLIIIKYITHRIERRYQTSQEETCAYNEI